MNKHKHYDVIVAWAEGKQIQMMYDGNWSDYPIDCEPAWREEASYRIKPEPKPDVVLLGSVLSSGFAGMFTTEPSALYSQYPDNLRLTFDGETGKLKSAEVI
jgi:hypothetical protein